MFALRPTTTRITPRLLPTLRTYTSQSPTGTSPGYTSDPGSSTSTTGNGTSTHTTRKRHELDVQSKAAHSAMRERQGSSETPEARGPRQDTKGDHPKAPEPVIGMEDERGDKGQGI